MHMQSISYQLLKITFVNLSLSIFDNRKGTANIDKVIILKITDAQKYETE